CIGLNCQRSIDHEPVVLKGWVCQVKRVRSLPHDLRLNQRITGDIGQYICRSTLGVLGPERVAVGTPAHRERCVEKCKRTDSRECFHGIARTSCYEYPK